MTDTVLLVCLCAAATYLTRTGGHLLLSRVSKVHHRAEAALNAVPVAVLTALVAPSIATDSIAEAAAIAVTGLLALRFSLVTSVAAGMASVVLLRTLAI
ncbi:MAG: AzlD domain-containing protein [Roseibium sp.]